MDNNTTVVVTAASSFIAAPILRDLLRAGVQVRGTVRKIGSSSSKHVTVETLSPESKGNGSSLTLFEADLIKEGSFDEAMQGADFLIHCASPVALSPSVKNPEKRLVEPAVKGVENVLNSVSRSGTIKRVAMTSSIGAVSQGPQDKAPGETFGENDWADSATLRSLPYAVSKREAERKAWAMAKDASWDLITICPGLVWGRNFSGRDSDSSLSVIKRCLKGEYRVFINIQLPCNDLDDVAEAHVRALTSKDAKGRYVMAQSIWTKELMNILHRNGFAYYPLAKFYLPRSIATSFWAVLPIQKHLVFAVGRTWEFDSERIQKDLGFENGFREIENSITLLAKDLVDSKIVKKRKPSPIQT